MDNNKLKELVDHSIIINELYDIIQLKENNFISYEHNYEKISEKFNFKDKNSNNKNPIIVTAGDTAVELGSPRHATVSSMLWTVKKNIVKNKIWVTGKDFNRAGKEPITFAIIVITEIDETFDPTGANFSSIKNLSNKVPGYMARSIPGKIWIRINKKLIKQKFSLEAMAQCLVKAYHEEIENLKSIDVVLVSDNSQLTDQLATMDQKVRVISRDNTKLILEADGTLSCDELDCNFCDSEEECDTIRDMIVYRKNNN